MAKMKTVSIEAKSDDRFKVEVKAGNHTLYVDQPTTGGGTEPSRIYVHVPCGLHRHGGKNHCHPEEAQIERHADEGGRCI